MESMISFRFTRFNLTHFADLTRKPKHKSKQTPRRISIIGFLSWQCMSPFFATILNTHKEKSCKTPRTWHGNVPNEAKTAVFPAILFIPRCVSRFSRNIITMSMNVHQLNYNKPGREKWHRGVVGRRQRHALQPSKPRFPPSHYTRSANPAPMMVEFRLHEQTRNPK